MSQRAGRRLAEELFDADRTTSSDALRDVRSRRKRGSDR